MGCASAYQKYDATLALSRPCARVITLNLSQVCQIQQYTPFSMFLVVNRCSQLLLPYLLSSFLNQVELVHFDIAKDLVLTAWPLHFHGLGARSFA